MESSKLSAIGTSVIAFSTFLGVLFALIYYLYLIINVTFLGASLGGIVYIDINLLFLYVLKKRGVFE